MGSELQCSAVAIGAIFTKRGWNVNAGAGVFMMNPVCHIVYAATKVVDLPSCNASGDVVGKTRLTLLGRNCNSTLTDLLRRNGRRPRPFSNLNLRPDLPRRIERVILASN